MFPVAATLSMGSTISAGGASVIGILLILKRLAELR
jgi:hypothetical protein